MKFPFFPILWNRKLIPLPLIESSEQYKYVQLLQLHTSHQLLILGVPTKWPHDNHGTHRSTKSTIINGALLFLAKSSFKYYKNKVGVTLQKFAIINSDNLYFRLTSNVPSICVQLFQFSQHATEIVLQHKSRLEELFAFSAYRIEQTRRSWNRAAAVRKLTIWWVC